jgi:AcrR family transcriptional regulator
VVYTVATGGRGARGARKAQVGRSFRTLCAMADGARADKKELTRASIEEAALQLFTERGYDKTDVAAIAERAGVSRRTFFRHFRSKSEVVFGDEQRVPDQLRAAMKVEAPTTPACHAVARAVLDLAAGSEDRRERTLPRARLVAQTTELLQHALLLQRRWAEVLADELAGRAGRSEPTVEDRVVSSWGIGAYAAALHEWVDQGTGLTALAEVALAVPIVHAG